MMHFFNDAQIGMASAYGGTGRLVVVLVGFGCMALLVWRSVVDQQRRLNPGVPTRRVVGPELGVQRDQT